MSVRRVGQISLADRLAESPRGSGRSLVRISALVEWPMLAALVMFKALLLQQWYGLSDPGLEEALADRLSFRRFVGLSLTEATPDRSTISRFRTALGAPGGTAGARGLDRISHRPNKHHPLTHWQERRNKAIAHRRSAVERVFAIAKCLMGWRRVRYRGLRRNATHLDPICMAINLKRWAVLVPVARDFSTRSASMSPTHPVPHRSRKRER